jgi:hypothetical protein
LLQLIDSAMLELGPEIHHTVARAYKEDLKEQRRELRALRDLLGGPPATLTQVVESADALGVA